MSQLRPPFRQKISFTIRKTKPRKVISRSPLKFSAENLARELGPIYQIVDVRIGTQRMILDTTRGGWVLDETEVNSQTMTVLEKKKYDLQEENNILRTKLDVLLEILAQVNAEDELERTNN